MKTLLYTLLFAFVATDALASQSKKQITLRLQASTGDLDQTTIYFDQGITSPFVMQQDADKIFGNVSGIPTVYSFTSDNIACSVNGYSTLSNSEVIPIGVSINRSGMFTFTAPLIDNFDPSSIIRLEDKVLGHFTDLRKASYQVMLDTGAITDRFFLHLSRAVTFSTQIAGCNNNDGVLSIDQDSSITWTSCQIADSNGNVIAENDNTQGTVSFNNLPEGDYTVTHIYGGYNATHKVHVNGTYITAVIAASSGLARTGEEISFTSSTINTQYLLWTFGDGSYIDGVENPQFAYLIPGTYEVNLKCSNDHGCSYEAKTNVTVNDQTTGIHNQSGNNSPTLFALGKTVTVNLKDMVNNNAEVKIFNLLGQAVYTAPLTEQHLEVSLDGQPDGYYVISLKNAGKTNTRKLYVGKQ
jgi:PKD repeat protein